MAIVWSRRGVIVPPPWAAALVVIAIVVASAGAQMAPPGLDVVGGHGWMTLREEAPGDGGAPRERVVLEYFPPRLGTGAGADEGGVVRRAAEFDLAGGVAGVDVMAAAQESVYVVLPEEPRGEGSDASNGLVRRVLTMSAVRSGGLVGMFVPEERARVLPSLASDRAGSDIAGAAAMDGTHAPFVSLAVLLVDRTKDGATRHGGRLMALGPEGWVRVDAPWESAKGSEPSWAAAGSRGEAVASAGETVRMLSWRDGIAIALAAPGEDDVSIWVGRPRAVDSSADGGPAVHFEWMKQVRPLAGSHAPGEGVSRPLRLAFIEGSKPAADVLLDLSLGAGRNQEATLYSLGVAGPAVLANLGSVPKSCTIVPMSAPGAPELGPGRLTLAWRAKRVGGAEPLTLREISSETGATLYSGPAKGGESDHMRRLQALTIIGVLLMVGVLVFILRGTAARGAVDVRVAEGVRPVNPVRRLVAASLDLIPSVIGVSVSLGLGAFGLLSPSGPLGSAIAAGGDADLRPLGLVILLTIVHTSVMEWLTGQSVGKLIMGLRVVDARVWTVPGGEGRKLVLRRPALWQALVRNLVRWTVPVLAMLALLDSAGRHPGDLAARTMVVEEWTGT
jgi:hypothetical protein